MQVNLTRRAEIGSAKRARTRAAILGAARECYAAGPLTVDSIMTAAGLGKGTFYVHFEDLAALEAELGVTLIAELDEHLQPARLSTSDPLSRLATATTILLRHLGAQPERARLASRAAAAIPDVGRAVLMRMREDVAAAQAAGSIALPSHELAAGIVTAIFLHATKEFGLGRSDMAAVPHFVAAILRAIGCAPDDAAARAGAAAQAADNFADQFAATKDGNQPPGRGGHQ